MTPGVTRSVLVIMGMRDNHSREQIVEILESIAGVCDVEVNLLRGRATVVHGRRCAPADLVGAVARAGYGASLNGDSGNKGPARR